MDCHDVQQLLAFMNRRCEELDAPEREALREHIEKCPDCTAALNAENAADAALAALMRDVPLPADLRQKVSARLAAERSRLFWQTAKRTSLVAAAAFLVAVAAPLAWNYWPLPEARLADVSAYVSFDNWNEAEVEQYLKERGLTVRAPADFNYNYLQRVDVVEFKNRRVAQLTFTRTDDRPAMVSVLILSTDQFRMNELAEDVDIQHTTQIRIRHDRDHREYTYLIFYRGDIDAVSRRFQ